MARQGSLTHLIVRHRDCDRQDVQYILSLFEAFHNKSTKNLLQAAVLNHKKKNRTARDPPIAYGFIALIRSIQENILTFIRTRDCY